MNREAGRVPQVGVMVAGSRTCPLAARPDHQTTRCTRHPSRIVRFLFPQRFEPSQGRPGARDGGPRRHLVDTLHQAVDKQAWLQTLRRRP